MKKEKNILEIKDLTKIFPVKRGVFFKQVGEVKAIDNVSFKIERGSTYGLVGESGSGKSTLARSILKLIDYDEGDIIFNGVNISDLDEKKFRPYRSKIQIVLQDPLNSLDPRYKVKNILKEALLLTGIYKNPRALKERVDELLEMVNLSGILKDSYPYQLSGGQSQRVCIARALCGNPDLIIWDEPTSGLDITTASKLLKLLIDIQKESNISYLFISHDLKIVRRISHIIGVMFNGKIIEEGLAEELFTNPIQAYTKKLLKSSLFE